MSESRYRRELNVGIDGVFVERDEDGRLCVGIWPQTGMWHRYHQSHNPKTVWRLAEAMRAAYRAGVRDGVGLANRARKNATGS